MGRPRNASKQSKRLLACFLEDPQLWRYGYDLAKACNLASGTLYPALARLTEQGVLESRWEAVQRGPQRHLYRLTGHGVEVAQALLGPGTPRRRQPAEASA